MINPWDIPAGISARTEQDLLPVDGGKRGAGSQLPGLLRAFVFSPLLIPVAAAVVVAVPLGSLAALLVNAAGACFNLYDRLARPEQRKADDAAYAAAVSKPVNVIPFHNGTRSRPAIVTGTGKSAPSTTTAFGPGNDAA